VVEGGEDFGFALETGKALRVGSDGFGQHLDGHLTAELRVVGPVDLAHATFAELGGDLEMGKRGADHREANLFVQFKTNETLVEASWSSG
jgi:hypothetical protein